MVTPRVFLPLTSRDVAAEAVSGAMLLSGIGLAFLQEIGGAATASDDSWSRLVTGLVALLSAGGVGGLVARTIGAETTKRWDEQRKRDAEDRAAEREERDADRKARESEREEEKRERDRMLALLDRQIDYLRSLLAEERTRNDTLIARITTVQVAEAQTVNVGEGAKNAT